MMPSAATASSYGVEYKTDLPWEAMREIAEESKTVFRDHGFSDELEKTLADPMRQLVGSVISVFESWNKERAQRYRDIKHLALVADRGHCSGDGLRQR